MALNYVTLTANYVDGSGDPISRGTVSFWPTSEVLDSTDHLIVTQKPVIVDLSRDPLPTVQLVATDNSGLSPVSWAWNVFPNFPGAPPTEQFALPFASGATQYLSDLLPPVDVTGFGDGGTVTGPLILLGSPPLQIPAGAADGDVLTSDASGNASWQAAGGLGPASGDLSGSYPSLTVAKIQGTAVASPPGVSTQYLAGDGSWQTVPGGGSGLGVTLSGTPAAGTAVMATSSSTAQWLATYGTRPEAFGVISGTSGDDVALNAASTAINAGFAPSPLVITQKCAVDATVTLLPGVNVVCSGQGNRQVFPDTFTGGYICPSSSFPTGSATPLLAIGTASAPTTNPNGITLDGLCLTGLVGGTGSTYAANCVGLLVTDTADVHVTNAFLADFDRPGGTGTAIKLASATAGNGVGFNLHHSVISASWRGLYADGAGTTDLRMSGNLWHSNTQQVSIGPAAGGGGYQIVNDHFTYTGMPSGGYHLSTGSQAGDFTVLGCYFDQAGNTVCVQLGNDKGVVTGCHWLATGGGSPSTAVSLAKVTVGSPAELTFTSNSCNANGSAIQALLQTTGHAGVPAGGIWLNNVVYGTSTGPLVAPLIDSAAAAIPQITQPPGGTTTFLRADGTWAAPAGGGGGGLPITGGTMTGWLAPAVVALTDASSITVNAALGNDFRVTLAASGHVLATPANPVDGQAIRFTITQGSGGSKTLGTLGSAYDFGAAGQPTLSTAAGAVDVLGFAYNSALGKWMFLGSSFGL